MSLTRSEIIDALNKHRRNNYSRGGEWIAEGGSAVFVDRESRQVITSMPFQKAAWVAGDLAKLATDQPNPSTETGA